MAEKINLGQGILEQILTQLIDSDGKSYEELGKETGIDKSKIITTLLRHADLFEEAKKEGHEKFWKLSAAGNLYVKNRIEEIKNQQRNAEASIKREESELKNAEDVIRKIKEFIELYPHCAKDGTLNFEDIISFDINLGERLLDKPESFMANFEIALEEKGLDNFVKTLGFSVRINDKLFFEPQS